MSLIQVYKQVLIFRILDLFYTLYIYMQNLWNACVLWEKTVHL